MNWAKNKHTGRNIVYLFILITAISITGCVSERINLVENGKVKLQVKNSERAQFCFVDVYKNHDTCCIYGRIKRLDRLTHPYRTTVGIEIVDENGKMIKKYNLKDIALPVNKASGGINSVSFRKKLSSNFIEGSTIKLSCGSGKS